MTRRRRSRWQVAAFATFQLLLAGSVPLADELLHARSATGPTSQSGWPGTPEHDPFACAICQHLERNRSAAAGAAELALLSPAVPVPPALEPAAALLSVHSKRPRSRDPPRR